MYRAGIPYAEGFQEFKKQFILTVLRDLKLERSESCHVLRAHRNTLARTLRELDLDVRSLPRAERRRPAHGVGTLKPTKLAS